MAGLKREARLRTCDPAIIPFDLVIPGCALLGADPESSAMHCSGFRVRSLSDKIDFVNFCAELAPRNDGFRMDARVEPAHDEDYFVTAPEPDASSSVPLS
jgi:hypothetical protein